jgi:hypothetical protein
MVVLVLDREVSNSAHVSQTIVEAKHVVSIEPEDDVYSVCLDDFGTYQDCIVAA